MRPAHQARRSDAQLAWLPALAVALACRTPAHATPADAVTYQTDVRPVFTERCLGCHNTETRKGDLDLSSHAGVMAGGSGGAIAVPGQPESSRLWLVMTHAAEPRMPPRGDRTPDPQLELVRRWIADGCIDAKGGRPAPTRAPVRFASAPSSDASSLMDLAYPLTTCAPSSRAPAVASLAAHPVSPVLAAAARGQVLLYRLPMLEPIGALQLEGLRPTRVGFTRDGRQVFAAVGRGAASGQVRVWDASTGEPLVTVGDEVDEVLACDVDLTRDRVALGGPSRIVKVHRGSDGALVHRLAKHTDWITSISYSPDGVLMATADRGGGLLIWEGESGAAYLTLGGHPGAIRAVDWSPDGNLLVSCAEDGRVRMWDVASGSMVKEWSAHPQGALHASVSRDGTIVTAGRDRLVKLWNASGALVRQAGPIDDIALAAARSSDDMVVVGSSLSGTVTAWRPDGSPIGTLVTNPPSLDDRLRVAEASEGGGVSPSVLAFLKAGQAHARRLELGRRRDDATQRDDAARAIAESARERLGRAESMVADLDLDGIMLSRRLESAHERIRLMTSALVQASRAMDRLERTKPFRAAAIEGADTVAKALMLASSESMLDEALADRAFAAADAVRAMRHAEVTARRDLDAAERRLRAAEAALALELEFQSSLAFWQATADGLSWLAAQDHAIAAAASMQSSEALTQARRSHDEAVAEHARWIEAANRPVAAAGR